MLVLVRPCDHMSGTRSRSERDSLLATPGGLRVIRRSWESGEMYWIGAGLVAMRTLCGTFMRLALFGFVLLGALIVAIVSAPMQRIFEHFLIGQPRFSVL